MSGASIEPNQLIVIFTVLLSIALAAERLIEVAKPLILKITNLDWQSSVKIVAAIVIGFGRAAMFQFNLLAALTVTSINPVFGYLMAGIVSSVGSSVLHAILEWLKTLQTPTSTTTIKQTSTAQPPQVTTTVTSQSPDPNALG